MIAQRPTADYMCEKAELFMTFMGEPSMKVIVRDIVPNRPQSVGVDIGTKRYHVVVSLEEVPTTASNEG